MTNEIPLINDKEARDRIVMMLVEEEENLKGLESLGFRMPRPSIKEQVFRKAIDALNEKI